MTPIQREHVDLIRRTNGVLRPEDVLQDARNPNSPLHECFTWDNSVAAEAYRLIQARAVIRVAVRFSPMPAQPVQRVRVTLLEPKADIPDPREDDGAADLLRMNLRESEITVLIHVLTLERQYLVTAMTEAGDRPLATERYAIDLFVRGVPMDDLVEVVNFSGEGEACSEADVLRWVQSYGGHRPARWSPSLAKQQWDADEGNNYGDVYGVPAYKPPRQRRALVSHGAECHG